MNETSTTISTTAVPMSGYDDYCIAGSEWGSTLLHFIGKIQQESIVVNLAGREGRVSGYEEKCIAGEELVSTRLGIDVPATDRFSFPRESEPGEPRRLSCLGVDLAAGSLESSSQDYLDAVRAVWVSLSLAAQKANMIGDLTRPIVLHRAGRLRERVDLRSREWFVQHLSNSIRFWDEDPQPQNFERVAGAEFDVAAFLDEVYELAQYDLQSATDRIFDRIDRLLCDGREDICDEILSRVDVARLPSALLRSFLTITAPAKHSLPSRRPFFAKAYDEVSQQRGPEMAERLFSRLA
jgi:hypothetical protein